MTDKLVIAVCLAALGAIVGLIISRRLKCRREYFLQLDKFLFSYLTAVGFSKNTLPEVVKNYTASSNLLSEHLNSLNEWLFNSGELSLKQGELSVAEVKFVIQAMQSLGKNDANSEKAVISGVRQELASHIENAEGAWRKYGSASIKLGFLCGLLLAVICM